MSFLFQPLHLFAAVLIEYVRQQQEMVIEYPHRFFANRMEAIESCLPTISGVYSVEDRGPRACPWVNESDGGTLLEWKSTSLRTGCINSSTM